MRSVICVAAVVLPLLGGCETFEESYLIEQDVLINENGVQVNADLEEDFFGGQWRQFRAYNSNSFSVCVQVTLSENSQTSGHSMGVVHRLEPQGSADVGYVTLPASFAIYARVWDVDDSGACGYPPG